MPSYTAYTINDGQATPVAHSFGPSGEKDGGSASFVDRSPVISALWKKITHVARMATSANAANRVQISILDPVGGTVDGQTVKIGQNLAKMEFNFRQNATDQEKKDLVAYASNWLGHATVKDGIIKTEPFY